MEAAERSTSANQSHFINPRLTACGMEKLADFTLTAARTSKKVVRIKTVKQSVRVIAQRTGCNAILGYLIMLRRRASDGHLQFADSIVKHSRLHFILIAIINSQHAYSFSFGHDLFIDIRIWRTQYRKIEISFLGLCLGSSCHSNRPNESRL